MFAPAPTSKDLVKLRSKGKYDSLNPAVRYYISRIIELDGDLFGAAAAAGVSKQVADSFKNVPITSGIKGALRAAGASDVYCAQRLVRCMEGTEYKPNGKGGIHTGENLAVILKATLEVEKLLNQSSVDKENNDILLFEGVELEDKSNGA